VIQIWDLVAVLLFEVGAQDIGEEAVVAVPLASVVERDYEQVGSIEPLQDARAGTVAGDGVAKLPTELLEDGRAQQEASDRLGLAGEYLLHQVGVMIVICAIVLVDQRAHLSDVPFSWAHLTGALAGLSAGFPLALYMFIGWENGPALAEESHDPRRTIPRALYISIAIGVALFVFAYATITGFYYNISSIGRSSVPFLTVADHYLGGPAVLAWIAGIVSVLATLIAGANSQARMLFDGGRTGLLPAWLGHATSIPPAERRSPLPRRPLRQTAHRPAGPWIRARWRGSPGTRAGRADVRH
jgi:hypothetical protein